MHLHREVLSLPLFETASKGCRKLLSLKIRTNFCAPDEYLIHKGDALQNIYYLFHGSMEVVNEDGKVVAILGKGDLFGSDINVHIQAAKDTRHHQGNNINHTSTLSTQMGWELQ